MIPLVSVWLDSSSAIYSKFRLLPEISSIIHFHPLSFFCQTVSVRFVGVLPSSSCFLLLAAQSSPSLRARLGSPLAQDGALSFQELVVFLNCAAAGKTALGMLPVAFVLFEEPVSGLCLFLFPSNENKHWEDASGWQA